MELTVAESAVQDSWKDIVRIKKDYRKDRNGAYLRRGAICRITANGWSKWVVVHGREPSDRLIQMDLSVRLALKTKVGEKYDFQLDRLSWLQSLWFPWKASDPIYRVPAQLALVSLIIGTVLGLIGIGLGLEPILRERYAKAPTLQSNVFLVAPTPGSPTPAADTPERH
jgi:hypothetical protein